MVVYEPLNTGCDFTKSYSLSKTIRFELVPVGRTADHIVDSGLLEEDMHRADSYKKVKQLIDEYHKAFIDRVLSSFQLPVLSQRKKDSLEEYLVAYHAKQNSDSAKADFDILEIKLRGLIANALKNNESFKRLFQKELIKDDLKYFIENATTEQLCGMDKKQANSLVEEFNEFTTYFQGFHKNRKNMYSEEEHTTAISYRLINDNLPKFIDNMATFDKIYSVPEIKEKVDELYSHFESYPNVASISEMFQLEYFNTVLTQKQIDVYNSIIGGRTDNEGHENIMGLNQIINLYNQQHKESRLPKLKVLYKQILSDRNAISWLPEKFNSPNETLQAIKAFYDELNDAVLGEKNLKQLLETVSEYQLQGVYICSDNQLTDISQKAFGSWSVIPNAIKKQIGPARKKERK